MRDGSHDLPCGAPRPAVPRLAWLRRTVRAFLCLLMLVPAAASVLSRPATELVLPPEAQAWLATHPIVTVGVSGEGWPPFEIVKGTQVSGLSWDYADESFQRLGLTARIRTYPSWTALYKAVCEGEVDLVMSVAMASDRKSCLVFSSSYFEALPVIVARERSRVRSEPDLAHSRLAIVDWYAYAETLPTRYPAARFVKVDTSKDALVAVRDGTADAFLINAYTAQALLAQMQAADLRIVGSTQLPFSAFRFGVTKQAGPLASALDVALDSLSVQDHAAIRHRWLKMGGPHAMQRAPWTTGEAEALRRLPVLRVGYDPGAPPFSFNDAFGQPSGLSPAYLRRVAQVMGLRLRFVPTADLAATLAMAAGGKVDIVIGAQDDGSAPPGFVHTLHYASFPLAAVVREDTLPPADLAELRGRRMSINMALPQTQARLSRLIGSEPVAVSGASAGLRAVARGDADVYFGNLAVVDQLLHGEYAGRLKVVAMPDMELHSSIAVAKRYDWLVPLMNRVLEGVPTEEQSRLHNAWIRYSYNTPVSWMDFLRRFGWPVSLLVLALATVLVAYARLRRESSRRRRAEEAAEEAAQVKGRFLATMSHEIRTPMHGIIGMLEVVQASRLDAEQRHLLALIDEAAGALGHILDDVLDFSKIEEGKLRLEQVSVNLRDLAESTVMGLMRDAAAKELIVDIVVTPGVATRHMTDATRLRQLLSNLVANAIKFTPRGSVEIHLDGEPPTGNGAQLLALTVRDTGIGVAPDRLARLFEPFHQADVDIHRHYGGTGLGLAISRQLATLMGGSLSMLSEEGVGTAVRLDVTLPVDMNAVRERPLSGLTVAVPTAAGALSDVLDELGARVIASENVEVVHADVMVGHPGVAGISGIPVLTISPVHLAAGYRITEAGAEISIHPLSRRALLRALDTLSPRRPESRADTSRAGLPLPLPGRREPIHEHAIEVLVVEDNPINQELIRRQLGLLGLSCRVVGDGQAALQALRTESFLVVLTDLFMGTMDGYEWVARWRAEEAASGATRIPIIVISAAVSTLESRSDNVDFDARLSKPLRLEALATTLRRYLPGMPDPGAHVATASVALSRIDLTQATKDFGGLDVAYDLLAALIDATEEELRRLDSMPPPVEPEWMAGWIHYAVGAMGTFVQPSFVTRADTIERALRDGGLAAESMVGTECLVADIRGWIVEARQALAARDA
jgi:signal transduction histidine kinase/CheY-like chemotaxis protein